MRDTKTCPKCGGHNIVIITNDGHPDPTQGNNLMCNRTILSGVIYVKRYICCGCGYTEDWIDKNDLGTLLNSKKIQR